MRKGQKYPRINIKWIDNKIDISRQMKFTLRTFWSFMGHKTFSYNN